MHLPPPRRSTDTAKDPSPSRPAHASGGKGPSSRDPRQSHAVAHDFYNQHRPHRAMDLRPPDGGDTPVADLATVRIRRHKVLGGLINEYERAA